MTAKKQPPQKPPASLVVEPAAAGVAALDPAVAKELADLKRKNEQLMQLLEAHNADKTSQPGTPQQKQVFTPPAAVAKAPPMEPPSSVVPDATGTETSPGMVLDPNEAELAQRFDLSDKDMITKKHHFTKNTLSNNSN